MSIQPRAIATTEPDESQAEGPVTKAFAKVSALEDASIIEDFEKVFGLEDLSIIENLL